MKKILVVAPHPDDETLGCGGTILKHKHQGDQIHWLIVTGMKKEYGYSLDQIQKRKNEIREVADAYSFSSVHLLEYPPAQLDSMPLHELIQRIHAVFEEIQPEVLYLPYPGDAHTDHRVVFEAAIACAKWFRNPYVKRVLVYETLSETDFSIQPDRQRFHPNYYVDITPFLESKIQIMRVYASEMSDFPFPRSEQAIRGLSYVRGAASGCIAAEAFMLIKEIER
ncbi:MAG: PIG-L family deacetylase [Brevibacillus sp.]|nr:PIG-L family deacetylase [Brevibacillus sp.]